VLSEVDLELIQQPYVPVLSPEMLQDARWACRLDLARPKRCLAREGISGLPIALSKPRLLAPAVRAAACREMPQAHPRYRQTGLGPAVRVPRRQQRL
jgi:hypothetical protein